MNKFHLSLFTFFIFTIHSCKEVGPDISLKNNRNVVSDTTYVESPVAIAELKNVVLEEFTGVKCTNCPQGHQVIASIKAANPNRIVSVSMHPENSLGFPYPFSAQDLRNSKAHDLMTNYFSYPNFEPNAGIDRQKFSGENYILLDRNKWTGYVTQEIALTTPVNLLLSQSYDTTTRELTIVTELHYTKNVTEENKLTVIIAESNIVTAQLDGSEIDTFYVHKDVLRDFVSDTRGDQLDVPLDAGRVVRKVYKKILDAAWKPVNMKVLAYVHEYVNSKIVYQVKEIDVE